MPGVASAEWGDGARLFSFASKSGFLRCRATNYGATLVSVEIADGAGGYDELTLGYDTLGEYKKGTEYFGATVGRYGNRIRGGRFELDGRTHRLPANDGANTEHGGPAGFDKQLWRADPVETEDADGVRFSLLSADGDAGFPGALAAEAWVMLGRHDELLLKWRARVDGAATVVNLTNHAYWNLAAWRRTGDDALAHRLRVDADRYVEVAADSIPTGRLAPVRGTVLDFRGGRELGDGVDDALVAPQRGYDQCLAFAPPASPPGPQPAADGAGGAWAAALPLRAELLCPATGYGFHVHTSQPGVQVYTANYVEDGHRGFGGAAMRCRGAVCVETQNFPDAPNQPGFPSPVLRPGEVYEQTTAHRFFSAAPAAP